MDYILQSKEIGRMDKKKLYNLHCLQDTHFRSEDTKRLKVKQWEMIVYANGIQQEAGVGVLILGKIDFKSKTVTGDKEERVSSSRRHSNYKYIYF